MLTLHLAHLDDDKDKQLFENIFNSYKKQMLNLAITMLNNKIDVPK